MKSLVLPAGLAFAIAVGVMAVDLWLAETTVATDDCGSKSC